MKDIRWLFFDMGSTLIDERVAYEYWLQEIARLSGTSHTHVYELALHFYKQNQKGDREAARLLGVPLPEWPTQRECLYEDAIPCLMGLSKKYKIGIIANQLPGAQRRLARYGLLSYVDVVVTSAEAGVAKPDPGIFRLALQAGNCSPAAAVMIGDRIDNDILPANALGFHTVWIRRGFGQYWSFTQESEHPDYTISNLCDLNNIL